MGSKYFSSVHSNTMILGLRLILAPFLPGLKMQNSEYSFTGECIPYLPGESWNLDSMHPMLSGTMQG